MKRPTYVAVAALLLSSTAVHANGILPAPPPPPVVVPVDYDWSGAYAGVFVGYGSGSYEFINNGVPTTFEADVEGEMFGGRLGYNFQNGSLVYGVDASIMTGIDGIVPQGTMGPIVSCNTGDCNVTIETLATVRGRVGTTFGATGNILGYGAAGIAFAEIDGGIENSPQQGSSNATGFTLAAGVEYGVSDAISVFGEVAYFDLGDLEFGDAVGPGVFEGDGNFTTLSVGVNFRF